MAQPFHIAIIGAGPAGCTLALLLLKQGIKVTVFEGEKSEHARSQGGTLDLHDDTGLAALKRADLFDEFNKKARYDGESMKITDQHYLAYVNMGGATKESSRGRPEIDRESLREILLNAMPKETVQWGHRLRRVKEDSLSLIFDHGRDTEEFEIGGFNLIVGADGVWSRVSPSITPVRPFYSGVSGARLTIPDVKERYPEIWKRVNRGTVFCFGDQRSVTMQQIGDGSLHVLYSETTPEEHAKELAQKDTGSLRQYMLDKCSDWAPEILEAIRAADANPWVAPLFMLPVGHRWVHKSGITLIGDAAHCMTPFAGEGVNLAMKDSLQLADAIIEATKQPMQLDKKVADFEADMFQRATRFQQLTYDMMRLKFMTTGGMDDHIEEYIMLPLGDSIHPIFHPLAKIAVNLYYWYFRWSMKDKLKPKSE